MRKRQYIKLSAENEPAAKADDELNDTTGGWHPYLSRADAGKPDYGREIGCKGTWICR